MRLFKSLVAACVLSALVCFAPAVRAEEVKKSEPQCITVIAITSHGSGATVCTTLQLAGTYTASCIPDPVGVEVWYRKTGTAKWTKLVIQGCGGTWSQSIAPGAGNYEVMVFITGTAASDSINNITIN